MSIRTSRSATRPRTASLRSATLANLSLRVSATRHAGNGLDVGAPNPVFADTARRHEMIARAAYFRAERRGFEPGHELEDWCAAECEINARLFRGEIPPL